MMLATNDATTAPNAVAMITATASATTSPLRMNSLKSRAALLTCVLPVGCRWGASLVQAAGGAEAMPRAHAGRAIVSRLIDQSQWPVSGSVA